MSNGQTQGGSKLAFGLCLLTGVYSLAVPLVITPIAVFRLSAAIHGHPIFGWALCFYLSNLIPGTISAAIVWKSRRWILLWLPLLGMGLSAALALLAAMFWALSGMNIQ